jgi:hypothetical protein
MPSTGPVISRRDALLGAIAMAMLASAATACGSEETPQPVIDDLEEQRDAAQKDSDLAAAAAKTAAPDQAPALNVVAAERAAHAKALAEEVARAAGTTTTSTAPATSTSTSTPPAPPPSFMDVRTALQNSAKSAADLAAKLDGYRAGLLGSIAASCNASVAVNLVVRKPI